MNKKSALAASILLMTTIGLAGCGSANQQDMISNNTADSVA